LWEAYSAFGVAVSSRHVYIDTYANQAVEDLKSQGADVNDADRQAPTVEVTAGGVWTR
jgi:hypothetical protein